jgi:hypothetical protein
VPLWRRQKIQAVPRQRVSPSLMELCARL